MHELPKIQASVMTEAYQKNPLEGTSVYSARGTPSMSVKETDEGGIWMVNFNKSNGVPRFSLGIL